MTGDKGQDFAPGSSGAGEGAVAVAEAPVGVKPKAAEVLAQIWGSIFLSAGQQAPKSIVVTSAESKEGATQLAAALALTGSSSEHGLRIALVDFNVTRPAIASLFAVRNKPGVADVVTGGAGLGSALVQAGIDRLDILPAGQTSGPLTPMLHSSRVGEMIEQLCQDHDHVIIDAPAVNNNATAQVLAGLTDGAILVVKSGVTRRESVAEAKKRIELAQGKILGVVLNQREFPIPGFLYRRL